MFFVKIRFWSLYWLDAFWKHTNKQSLNCSFVCFPKAFFQKNSQNVGLEARDLRSRIYFLGNFGLESLNIFRNKIEKQNGETFLWKRTQKFKKTYFFIRNFYLGFFWPPLNSGDGIIVFWPSLIFIDKMPSSWMWADRDTFFFYFNSILGSIWRQDQVYLFTTFW